MWPSQPLLDHEVFKPAAHGASLDAQASHLFNAENAYLRAEKIWKAHGIGLEDVTELSPKFWKMHMDPILLHGAAATILTIHSNLALGTISSYLKNRSDLKPIVEDLMSFKAVGQFCLTEVGHGLDVANMRTICTLLKDGSFELHSPDHLASKFMPPTVPVLGRPCYAVVWAQLIVEGQKRGIRPFVVKLNDGIHMSKGITAKLMPTRHGATPVNHAITNFNHVRLPPTALLGPIGSRPSTHQHFLAAIWRIAVGTLALSCVAVPALQAASYIAYHYSVRRKIGDPAQGLTPIISFRTQQVPIFSAVAQAYVLVAFQKHAVQMFLDSSLDQRARHAIATTWKATVMQHSQASHFSLSERCGAQGLFEHNQIVSQLSEMRGIVIAEGDILVLCIRLASELLLRRYEIPPAVNPDSLLAKHETGIFEECRTLAKKFGHRSQQFADYVLPRSQTLVESIGHRLAYEAAVAEGVPQILIDIYVCHVVNLDLGWYLENGLLTRARVADMQNEAMAAAFPRMAEWVDAMGVAPYVKAPILTEASWKTFADGLLEFRPIDEGVDPNLSKILPEVRAML